MKDRRDDARPRLKIVNDALEELFTHVYKHQVLDMSIVRAEWNEILNKHDINYNDLDRWSEL
jgi:hypothetical protein